MDLFFTFDSIFLHLDFHYNPFVQFCKYLWKVLCNIFTNITLGVNLFNIFVLMRIQTQSVNSSCLLVKPAETSHYVIGECKAMFFCHGH